MGGSTKQTDTPAPNAAPAAPLLAPTVDGPTTDTSATLERRAAMTNSLVGRSKLIIPLSSAFSGGSGVSVS